MGNKSVKMKNSSVCHMLLFFDAKEILLDNFKDKVIVLLKEYRTVLNNETAEIEEKKSRFIASVMPISNEDEALLFISKLKSTYWDARHNVYAYYLGGENIIQRFSDDGEPSGTAGMPVLEVIKRMGVQNVAVVVTRYFGGTLLGAAGLIRAYSKSASLAIEKATIIRKINCREINIVVEYTIFGKVQNLLLTEGHIIKDTVFEQDVEITVYIPLEECDAFVETVVEATNARAIIDIKETKFITVDINGKVI